MPASRPSWSRNGTTSLRIHSAEARRLSSTAFSSGSDTPYGTAGGGGGAAPPHAPAPAVPGVELTPEARAGVGHAERGPSPAFDLGAPNAAVRLEADTGQAGDRAQEVMGIPNVGPHQELVGRAF